MPTGSSSTAEATRDGRRMSEVRAPAIRRASGRRAGPADARVPRAPRPALRRDRRARRTATRCTLRPASPRMSIDQTSRPSSASAYAAQSSDVPPMPWRKTIGSPAPAHRYARVVPRPVSTSIASRRRGYSAQSSSSIARNRCFGLRAPPPSRCTPAAVMVRVYHKSGAEASGSSTAATARSPTPSSASRSRAVSLRRRSARSRPRPACPCGSCSTTSGPRTSCCSPRNATSRSASIQRLRGVGRGDATGHRGRGCARSWARSSPSTTRAASRCSCTSRSTPSRSSTRTLARSEALEVPRTMHRTIAEQLRRGRLATGVDIDHEAAILTGTRARHSARTCSTAACTAEHAFELLDYALATRVAGTTETEDPPGAPRGRG